MTPSPKRKHKGSILVIDDEPASLKLLFTILTEDDYALHERQLNLDLESQLRFVKDTLPDLVLVDVRKPGMDGYQVCAVLKNDPTTRAIPVIFISSIDRLINQAPALVSGAVDYVTDPFDAEEVLWRIETHISLRRLREYLKSAAGNHGAQPVAPNEDLERAFREIHILTQVTGCKHAEEKVRQAERELKHRDAFFAEAQRVSSTGSFSWRVATDGITWSAQTYRIYAIDHPVPVTWELIGSRIHPEDLPAFKEHVAQARRDATDLEFEHRLQLPDNSVKYVHVVAHGMRNHEGQLEYIGAVQDVTERRLSEDALGRLRSELAHLARVTTLGALTASVAHEVNQPLSGVITNASTCLRMLADNPPDVDGARETARRAIRDGNRAAEVIARLRALFGKKATATESLDLNESTREVLALSSHELRRGRVIVRTDLADELPPIVGDRVQLQQVVLNLLLNASDAMSTVEDRPRQLLLRTERHHGDRVRLTVQDTGVGFGPHNAEQLFDAFYTTKTGGMGIGLSVSRSIIEAHHGRLWAEPNDGPGATFSFSIPLTPQGTTDAVPVTRNS
jgi:signal transduction histidine kinase/DNA-binding response OmpR family regulator